MLAAVQSAQLLMTSRAFGMGKSKRKIHSILQKFNPSYKIQTISQTHEASAANYHYLPTRQAVIYKQAKQTGRDLIVDCY